MPTNSFTYDADQNLRVTNAGTAVSTVAISQATPGTTNAVAIITGQNGVAGGAGAVSATVQRVTLASNDPLVAAESPVSGATAITPSDTVGVTAGRGILINCTVAGNVKVRFSDTSTITIPVTVGLIILPWAITLVFVTGTTATATYANLS